MKIYQEQFKYYKSLVHKSIEQISEDELFRSPNKASNSIAVIMKHIAGNLLSRWTDIFETDGEKTWRNRDQEFVNSFNTEKDLLQYWESGWECLFNTLDGLNDDKLDEIIYIRNMGCSVHDAIIRQISHYAYHVGQIVYLARMYKDNEFITLSIPLGKSKEYNKKRFMKEKSIKHFTEDL